MEDWIRNVEDLMGTDYDDEPCPLLEEFEGDTSPHSLRTRTDAFLKRTDASDEVIHEIRDHLINDVLGKTVEKIFDTWRNGEVRAQRALTEEQQLMNRKTYFNVGCIFGKMLRSPKWRVHHEEIFNASNAFLLAIITVAKKYPHKPKNFVGTLLHFKVKHFLCEISMWAWYGIFQEDEIHEKEPALAAIPTELLLPTMRRLGMMDLLDPDWNLVGAWDGILDHIAQVADGFPRVTADKILSENSIMWSKARNSIFCRRCHRITLFGRGPPPQSFKYFSKCSVDMCCNIETAKKPHKHRCTKCYYFHFCSDACKEYADMFDLHDCDFTPPEKAASIKKEMEAYLGQTKTKKVSKHEICNFCRLKRADMPPDGTLLQCTGCERVAYVSSYFICLCLVNVYYRVHTDVVSLLLNLKCSKDCQLWDWSADHKSQCGKK